MQDVGRGKAYIAGWASMEDPVLQDDGAFVLAPLMIVFTFLVSKTEGVMEDNFALGHIYSQQVFNVLYLKPSRVVENSFQRVTLG